MQVSYANEVKIYNLSAGKSLPEVRFSIKNILMFWLNFLSYKLNLPQTRGYAIKGLHFINLIFLLSFKFYIF